MEVGPAAETTSVLSWQQPTEARTVSSSMTRDFNGECNSTFPKILMYLQGLC